MITIEEKDDLLYAQVSGEFTLADFKAFEAAMTGELKTTPKVKLVLDLSLMLDFTIDVAWEDIKFTREHAHDFSRIAIVTSDQWVAWLNWLNALFTDADIRIFDNAEAAQQWVNEIP